MDLTEYKTKLGKLSLNEEKLRDLYLRDISLGKIQGPTTGYASIDKPWLKYYNEETLNTPTPQKTIFNFVYENNKDNLDDVVFVFGREITYREFFETIDKIAKALIGIGIKKGEIVTVAMANTPESFYMLYALNKIGAIIDEIDAFFASPTGINRYLKDTNSKYIFANDPIFPKIMEIKDNNSLKKVVICDITQSIKGDSRNYLNGYTGPKDFAIGWEDFLKKGENQTYETVEFEENSAAVIEHTGGTTGFPKGAVLKNESLNAQALQFTETLGFKHNERWLGLMPIFSSFGLMGGHSVIYKGLTSILIPEYNTGKFADLVRDFKPNRVACSPACYEVLLDYIEKGKIDISCLRNPIVGGDLINKKTEEKLNEALKKTNENNVLLKGYASTEVTAGGTCNLNNKINKIISVGIPFPNVEIKIVDPDNNKELKYNELGEICFSGTNVMKEYYNNPQETEKVLKLHEDNKKWLHTGDVGYIDEDGFTYIKDRIKRIIIRNDGCKVYPSFVEAVILKHKYVKYCSVVGTDDLEHSQGKLPYAYVVLNDECDKSPLEIENEIYKICIDNLPSYSIPIEIDFVQQLSKTKIGKNDYAELSRQANIKIKRKSK